MLSCKVVFSIRLLEVKVSLYPNCFPFSSLYLVGFPSPRPHRFCNNIFGAITREKVSLPLWNIHILLKWQYIFLFGKSIKRMKPLFFIKHQGLMLVWWSKHSLKALKIYIDDFEFGCCVRLRRMDLLMMLDSPTCKRISMIRNHN